MPGPAESFPPARRYRTDGSPLQQITLAKSLGPKPVTYLSTSHGVELEVQGGSLVEEVHCPVTISPRLQFVECHTEGSGRCACCALAIAVLRPNFDTACYPNGGGQVRAQCWALPCASSVPVDAASLSNWTLKILYVDGS